MTNPQQPGAVGEFLSTGFGLVVISLTGMWIIEDVDSIALNNRLQGGGIHPRATDVVDGIL